MRKYFLSFLTSFLLAGCTPRKPEPPILQSQITVADDIGRKVALPKAPDRIISFAPNITEMIYALEAENKLIGVTAWCNYPPQARKKEIIGDAVTANMERILSLKPDLAIMVGTRKTPILSKLEALDISVLVLNPTSIGDISKDIRLLSVVLNKPAAADSLLMMIETTVKEISSSVDKIPRSQRPTVYAEISSQPLISAGKNSLIGQLIDQAGGRNIMADINQDYAVVNPEVIIGRQPDIIIILHPQTDREQLSRRIGWEHIPAVKNKKVFDDLDLDVVLRAGPRFALGLKELHERFYEK